MSYLIVVAAVFFLWNALTTLVTADDWVPWVFGLAVGIGGAALINPDEWWYGFGLAGLGYLMLQVSDLLLVANDVLRAKMFKKG